MDEKTKNDFDKVLEYIEDCWDENQEEYDGLTFDERVQKNKYLLSLSQQEILNDVVNW